MGGWWAHPWSAAPPTTAAVLRPKVIGPYRAKAFEVCHGRGEGSCPRAWRSRLANQPADGRPRSILRNDSAQHDRCFDMARAAEPRSRELGEQL
jgi:hypothetical protein